MDLKFLVHMDRTYIGAVPRKIIFHFGQKLAEQQFAKIGQIFKIFDFVSGVFVRLGSQ